EIVLSLVSGGQPFPRILLADTGAGSRNSGIDLILDENDCLLCRRHEQLGGAGDGRSRVVCWNREAVLPMDSPGHFHGDGVAGKGASRILALLVTVFRWEFLLAVREDSELQRC